MDIIKTIIIIKSTKIIKDLTKIEEVLTLIKAEEVLIPITTREIITRTGRISLEIDF